MSNVFLARGIDYDYAMTAFDHYKASFPSEYADFMNMYDGCAFE